MKTSTIVIGAIVVAGGVYYMSKRSGASSSPAMGSGPTDAPDNAHAGATIGTGLGQAIDGIRSLFVKVTSPVASAVGKTNIATAPHLTIDAPPTGSLPGPTAAYTSSAYSPWAQSLTQNRAPAQQQQRALSYTRSAGVFGR